MPLYGEHYQVYGGHMCALCNRQHERFTLEETSKSRFKLLQFAAELATFNKGQMKAFDMQRASHQQAALKERNKQHPNVPTILLTDPSGRRAPYIDAEIARAVSQEVLKKRDAAEAKGKSDIWRGTGSIMHRHNNEIASKGNKFQARDWKAMLGLLITPLGIYVGAAGTFSRQPNVPFELVAKRKGYHLCAKNPKDDTPSIGGVRVPKDMYDSAKVDGTASPGSCAAPQLIQQFIADASERHFRVDPHRSLTEQGFAMSEMYYVPNHSVRFDMMYPDFDPTQPKPNPKTDWEHRATDPGLYWIPGLSAHSCATCEKLVPMLLCPGNVVDRLQVPVRR
jgi:hypothetical protein